MSFFGFRNGTYSSRDGHLCRGADQPQTSGVVDGRLRCGALSKGRPEQFLAVLRENTENGGAIGSGTARSDGLQFLKEQVHATWDYRREHPARYGSDVLKRMAAAAWGKDCGARAGIDFLAVDFEFEF